MINSIQTKRERVEHLIKTLLRTKKLKSGDRLPAERILCQQLNVSRITLRAALANMTKSGVLIRKRRFGTFVNKTENSHQPIMSEQGTIIFAFYTSMPPSFMQSNEQYAPYCGARRYTEEHGKILALHDGQSFDRLLESNTFDAHGVLLSGSRIDDKIRLLLQRNIPVVVVDYMPFGISVDAVGCDTIEAGYLAGRKMMHQQCRRVLFSCIRFGSEQIIQPNYLNYIKGLSMVFGDKVELITDYVQIDKWLGYTQTQRMQALTRCKLQKIDGVIIASQFLLNSWLGLLHKKPKITKHLNIVSLYAGSVGEISGLIDTIHLDTELAGHLACKRLHERMANNALPPIRSLIPAKIINARA